MKHLALALLTGLMLAAPTIAQEKEIDLEQQMERLELEHARAEFEFEQEMRGVELEERHLKLDTMRRQLDRPQQRGKNEQREGLILVMALVHILMAIWVYQDVRRKNNGNGIWIVITVLAGFFGAAVYALIRLGDTKQEQQE
jgi:Flp pilus assembly protein TadB